MNEKIVSCSIFDPTKALFKQFKNNKAECSIIKCSLENCPLRQSGSCTWVAPIGYDACPYGKPRMETGYTKRARGFYSWLNQKREEYKDIPTLKIPPKRLAFIGDYVYLPYAHIDLNKGVPFIQHDRYLIAGCRFIPRPAWNINNVLSIIDFKPQAMFGGEIKRYQEEEVPKFIQHVRELDLSMWNLLIEKRPELNTEPVYIGRKALIKTLKPGIKWTTDKAYPVTWRWDGTHVITTGQNAYNNTWGGFNLQSLEIKGIPTDNATIVVLDNSWVTSDTQFMD